MNGFSTGVGYSRRLRNRIKCCLMENKQRCYKSAENLLYNIGHQEMVISRNLILTIDNKAGHIYVCDNHNTMIHMAKGRRKRCSNKTSIDVPKVDFSRLQLNTLRRYKRHLKLTGSGMNKAQLVNAVTKHFGTIQVNEKRIVNLFFTKIKPKRKNGYV